MRKAVFILTELGIQLFPVFGIGATAGHLKDIADNAASAFSVGGKAFLDALDRRNKALYYWNDVVKTKGLHLSRDHYTTQAQYDFAEIHEYCVCLGIVPILEGELVKHLNVFALW